MGIYAVYEWTNSLEITELKLDVPERYSVVSLQLQALNCNYQEPFNSHCCRDSWTKSGQNSPFLP